MTPSGSDLTLLDVIDAVFEVADSSDEAAAVVDHLLCTGRVRFRPQAGSRIEPRRKALCRIAL